MQISQIQQLVKALALDFLHNKTYNVSILQLLCEQLKLHSSTTAEEVTKKITVIDKGLQLLKQQVNSKKTKPKSKNSSNVETATERNFYNMVSILIFNISAVNQHYMNEIEKQMAESTASQSGRGDLDKTFFKDKMALQILKHLLKTCFTIFTEKSLFLQNLVGQIINNYTAKISQTQLALLQTIDYLCVKYSISNTTAQNIVRVLEKNQNALEQNSSRLMKPEMINEVNQLIFNSVKQGQLYKIVQLSSSLDLKNLIAIINANFLNTNPPRKIFNTAELSGRQTIEGIIFNILKRIAKNQLFTEKTQDYTPLRLLLFHFLNKHFQVYMQFNQILKSLMSQLPLNSQEKLSALRRIEKTFRILVPIQNPQFHQTVQFIYNSLSSRYSESAAFELIKKFLLNRFLLNPSFYVFYNDPEEQDIKKYVEAANLVRALFYPHKTVQLSQNTKCPQLVKIGSQIVYSLEYCLKKQKDNNLLIQNSIFLYINDKILKSHMQQFYDEVKQTFQSSRFSFREGVHLPNMISNQSVSFFLVKHDLASRNTLGHPVIENVSEVKLAMNSNRQNSNIKDNQSIKYMYEQLKTQKSQNQNLVRSPEKKLKLNSQVQSKKEKKFQKNNSVFGKVSQTERKQPQVSNETRLNTMTLPTDRQIIEELVQMRKQYGQLKIQLKKQCEVRRSLKSKKIGFLRLFTARFNQFKEEVQKDNNSIYIHMTSIA